MTKIGTWGGEGGSECDIDTKSSVMLSVTIRSGDTINAISFVYLGSDGRVYSVGPWGGTGGKQVQIFFDPTNYVEEISGTMGTYGGNDVVPSLKIVPYKGNPNTFGIAKGTPFRIPVLDGGKIVGFFGRSSDVLDAIGLYINN
ncbi:horcolin-like [Hordeum vulgare subsp. vulgare]|uniref:Jacalin-type lectin domain-containing protein n=1 Tax=Hordeum vulgare subsp. vulgare TaxID=112509 RepID=A0A8I6WM54_HORVV|nr:horcolin-like [Hordeum vulgare subsp. vulgare]